MIDWRSMSNEQLGAILRTELEKQLGDRLPEARKQAKAKAKAKARTKQVREQAFADAQQVTLDGFAVGGRAVPALELSEVDLNTVAPAAVRSLYNSALHRSGIGRLMPKEATWSDVVEAHAEVQQRLAAKATEKAEQAEVTAVVIEPTAKAKGKKARKRQQQIEAVMEARGCTEDEAREVLAGLGL